MKDNYFDDNRILIAKMKDKEKLCNTRNKIAYTDFLDMYQKSVLLKEVKENYIVFGGYDGAEREIILFYPDKITKVVANCCFNNIFKVIRIMLPNDLKEKYEHRVFLSGIMKIGLSREKFGDIIVTDFGADIVVFEENAEYIRNSISELKRFSKCVIEIIDISEISSRIDNYEEFNIIVPSLRVDSFVSEIARVSRSRADGIIEEGRVFINSEVCLKNSKSVCVSDILTIRGKGKFIVNGIVRETSKRKDCCSNKEEKIKKISKKY
ncbi:MAG: hypothetical protein IKF52_07275 [Clostridia bacterium]|nr:hypothetical protein [Clostridia bacterium]